MEHHPVFAKGDRSPVAIGRDMSDLKHGMMTVRPKKETGGMATSVDGAGAMAMEGHNGMDGMVRQEAHKPSPSVATMTVLSFVAPTAGLALAFVA